MPTITNCPPKVKAAMDKTMLAYAAWRSSRELLTKQAEKVLAENNFVICADYETRATKTATE